MMAVAKIEAKMDACATKSRKEDITDDRNTGK